MTFETKATIPLLQEGKGMHISVEVASVTVIPQNGRQPRRVWCLWETLGTVARFPAPPNIDLQKRSNIREHKNIRHTFSKVKIEI